MGIRRVTDQEFYRSKATPLTSLIKKVGSNYKPGLSEKKYYYDRNSKEVYENKPISLTKKDWAYYVVDFGEIVELKGLIKTLTERDNSCSLAISINYSAQVQPTHQKELIKLLIRENNTVEAINNRVTRWISAFSTNEPEFVKRFYGLKEQLINNLEDEARKLGLSLDLAIDVKGEDQSKKISGLVDVKVRDYQHKIPLSFELEVSVLEEKKVEGMQSLTDVAQLNQRVKHIIKDTINGKNTIDLDFLHSKLSTGLRDILIRELDVLLDKDGLKPEFLTLKSLLTNIPPEREQLQHKVKSITKNGYDINIDHHLILTRKNLGNYFNSGITNINQWVKSELERITQDYIFEKDFTELALQFDSDDIKVTMAKSVANKGYEIKQLITVPDLKDVIPKYFDFVVGKDHEFPTKKEEVKIRLNVVINGKIENPKKLTKYINPTVTKTKDGIIQKMKETVLNIVQQFIHRIDPQRYYMYFDSPDNEQNISLSDELKDNIISKLKSEFGANDIEIILKQLDTDLVKSFNALLGVRYPVYFENFTKQARFRSYFSIDRVSDNGYHLFIAKCEAYRGKDMKEIFEEIARVIKDRTQLELNTRLDYRLLTVITPEFIKYVLELLRKSEALIEGEFGLVIKYSGGIKRLPSKDEIKAQIESDEEIERFKEITKAKTTQITKEAKLLMEHETKKLVKVTDIDLDNVDEILNPEDHAEFIKKREAKIYDPEHAPPPQETENEEIVLPRSLDFDKDVINDKVIDTNTKNKKN